MNEICFDNSQNYLKNLNALMKQSDSLCKYKYFAINLCQDLFNLVDNLILANLSNKEFNFECDKNAIDEMKDFLKMIYMDIEGMSKKIDLI